MLNKYNLLLVLLLLTCDDLMLTLVLDGWAFVVFVLAFFNLLFMSAGTPDWTSSLRPGKTDLWSHCVAPPGFCHQPHSAKMSAPCCLTQLCPFL